MSVLDGSSDTASGPVQKLCRESSRQTSKSHVTRSRNLSFSLQEAEVIFCDAEDQTWPSTPSTEDRSMTESDSSFSDKHKMDGERDEGEDDEEDLRAHAARFQTTAETRQIRRSVTPHGGDSLCNTGQALPTPARSGLYKRRMMLMQERR